MKKILTLLLVPFLICACSKTNNSKPTQSTLSLTNDIAARAYVDSIGFNGVIISRDRIDPGGTFRAKFDGFSGGKVDVYISGGTTGSFIDMNDGDGKFFSKGFYTSGIHASGSGTKGDIAVKIYKAG